MEWKDDLGRDDNDLYNIDVDEFLKDEKIFRLVVGSLWKMLKLKWKGNGIL